MSLSTKQKICANLLAISIACLLILLSSCHCFADDYKITNEVRAIIHVMPRSGLAFPANLHKSNEAYVIVTTGAAYTNIYIASYARLNIADAIENAGLPISRLRDYSNPEYFVIGLSISHPKPNSKKAGNSIQLGRLINCLREGGIRPYVLLRLPSYTTVNSLSLPIIERTKFRWYNATHIPKDLIVTVHAQTPKSLSAFLYCQNYLLPFIALVSFLFGITISFFKKVPAKIRISIFDTGLTIPFMISMMMGSVMMFFNKSEFAYLLQDINTGTPDGEIMIGWLYCILCFIAPLLGLAIRGKMFRGQDEEPDVLDMDQLAKRCKSWAIFYGLITISVVLIILIFRSSAHLALFGVLIARSLLFSLVFSPVVIWWWLYSGMMRPATTDNEITMRAKELAAQMGVDIRYVKTAKSSYAKDNINGFAHLVKRTVVVTQKAVEALPPVQFDWLLAHELAHFKQIPYRRRTLRFLELESLIFFFVFVGMFAFSSYISAMVVLWMMALYPVCAFGCLQERYIVMRQLEYDSDREALLTVDDLDISISALKALNLNSKYPEDDQELDEHPKLIKRIKALQIAAREAGITEEKPNLLSS